MRPATHGTSKTAGKRARNATLAAAVGLSLILCGSVQTQGRDGGQGGATAAGPVAVAQASASGWALPAAGHQAAVTAPPTRRQARVATLVDIRIGKQQATYYRGGRPVATFNVSTGKRGWRTPMGTFRVYRKLSGWRRSRLGLMWRPAYFRGGYAIHGSRSVPRYPASHGCVRVAMSRMAWLAPQLPIGTTVRIRY